MAQPVDIIVQMDADGSHDPADIPRLITPIEQGADLVIGSRRVPGGRVIGWGPYRHATSFCAQWFARRILGFRTRDITAGFRAWRAETLRSAIADL
ncbi:MAG: glycosyltransferase [Candidatus Uhrbacteria bacterium]